MDDEDQMEAAAAAEDDSGPIAPEAAPQSTTPGDDAKGRLSKFLQLQIERQQRKAAPEYMGSQADSNNAMFNAQADNSYAKLLMDSASKFGSINGKMPSNQGFATFSDDLNQHMGNAAKNLSQEEMNRDQNDDRQAKLYEYLAQQQRADQLDDIKRYQAETNRKKLEIPDYGTPLIGADGKIQAINKRSGKLEELGRQAVKDEKPEKTAWHMTEFRQNGKPVMVNEKGETKVIDLEDIVSSKDKQPKTAEERLNGLNATEKGRLDNVKMALKSLADMNEALVNQGQDTFSLWGDNDYTRSSKLFTESLGRMQSGGAINKDEAKNFESMAPTKWDAPQIQKAKLAKLQEEMQSRLQTLGFKPEDVPDLAGYRPAFAKDKKPAGLMDEKTATAAEGGPKKTVVKQQYSKSADKTKVIYSDGSEEVFDGKR